MAEHRPPAGAEDDRGPLRAAFAGLTTRGRSFLAAGGAAAACAYLLGQPDLLRVGMLLAALPVLCVLVLHGTRSRVAAARRLSPARVGAGSEARVHLRVENVARVPSGLLLLQDRVPYVLGPRPRFVLDRIEPGGRREVTYRIRSDLRGRYPLGPLQLRLADPFGMVELSRSFNAYDVMTVLPRIESLPPVRLGGDAGGHGDGRQRVIAVAGDDDIIPRDYRHGDDLRRVHWRSTAHRGALMVRREEQPLQARCTVLLDTRRRAYAGGGPESAFERAVSGAASVVSHLVALGYGAQLVTDTGLAMPGPDTSTADTTEVTGLIMDALAVVDHSANDGLDGALGGARGGDTGLLIAFIGAVDDEQIAVLGRLRQRATGAVALLAAGQWDPAYEADRLRALGQAGWTALALHQGVPLGRLWQQAALELAGAGRGVTGPR
ncbi:DUF58 domain-containing protein [Streptomyces radicis]|uniref:DUF58 domain-containing protein n=1 Tax=Streptomyces radicis TaxID=1750517 RepID=A0A3A9VYN0_9ACTN|nr:DUF58 domain-containing protein [Streptomyces radicis]RKN06115.1 DUF58 domain-containing protein [Streptomyces radicis]RKN18484.1 DUF58 domain-containing protein [Streptomyces radicis]